MKFLIKNGFGLIAVLLLLATASNAQSRANALYSVIQQPNLSPQERHYMDVIERDITNFAFEYIQVDKAVLEESPSLFLPFLAQESADFQAVQSKIEYRKSNDFSWFGSIQGMDNATANFVNNRGFIHGLIITPNGVWEIEPLSKDLQVLTYKDPSRYEREECEDIHRAAQHKQFDTNQPIPVSEEGDEMGATESGAAGNCKIRLLVCYTDDVAVAHADPVGHIQLATDNYNNTNNNSAVFHDVEIARIMEVSYAETNNSSTDVNRFSGTTDGFMDHIHDHRNYYDADMACLILEQTGGCGRADAIGATASTAFQVTQYSCATGNLTFAHEFGHLLNARHDCYVDATPGTNHGWVNIANNWRTCMAYNDACADAGTSCTRLQYWSNPAISYFGNPMGGGSGACFADNESAIDAYDNTVAGFQTYIANKTFNLSDNIYDDEVGHLLAETSITTSSSFPVNFYSGSVGTYQAGSSITLTEGFWARSGTEFTAFLDNCTDPFSPPQSPGGSRNDQALANSVQHSTTLELYPNPVAARTTIAYDVLEKGTVVLEILDISGKVVERITEVVDHDSGKYRITHNMEHLSVGTYYLRMFDGYHTETVPFVKASF